MSFVNNPITANKAVDKKQMINKTVSCGFFICEYNLNTCEYVEWPREQVLFYRHIKHLELTSGSSVFATIAKIINCTEETIN